MTSKNQLRPISLTPSMSKIVKDFVIKFHTGPALLKVVDPDQFGAMPKSSTEQALSQSYMTCREKQMEHLLLSDLSFSVIGRHLM